MKLLSLASATTKRGPFCPITAVLLAFLSFVLGILNVLDVLFMSESSKLSCLVCFYLFSFLSYPPTLSHRVKRKFYKCSHRPTGTAHAYFKVRALSPLMQWTLPWVAGSVIIHQNDQEDIRYDILAMKTR